MSSKKESLAQSIGAGAGELALNLFDRLKKKGTNNQQQSNTNSNDLTASSLISNIAINIQKNLLNNNQNNKTVQINNSNITLSKLLSTDTSQSKSSESSQTVNGTISGINSETNSDGVNSGTSGGSNPSSGLEKSNIIIYDDDEFDDKDLNIEPINVINKPQISTSHSDFDLNMLNEKNLSHKLIAPSISLNTSINKSTIISENDDSSIQSKITSSSSKSKLTTVFDDILKSELANTATAEAMSLRKRILTKKKSIELSLENYKSKKGKLSSSSSFTGSSIISDDVNKEEFVLLKSEIINENIEDKTTKTDLILDKKNETNSTILKQLVEEFEQNSCLVKSENKNNELDTANNNKKRNRMKLSIILVVCAFVFILITRKYSFLILSYLFGLLNGLGIASLAVYLAFKFNLIKYFVNINNSNNDINSTATAEKSSNNSNLLLETATNKEKKNFDGVYKGWMNELREVYNPESYFLNKTRSVYINLDGIMLRLQTTTSRVPKRAVAGEEIGSVNFNEQRIYDLTDCVVSILPKDLCRKRYWSKKYPICLRNVKLFGSNKNLHQDLESKDEIDTISTLILFARTDREKEEWFNLFKKSSTKTLLDSSYYLKQIKLVQSSQDDNLADNLIKNTTTDDLLSLNQANVNNLVNYSSINFMNTFIIRIFEDFFTHERWINQIQTKIQNKLNKIKVPYFMEELRITGIDLGSVVPLIKQVSEPWYDEKGLWVHLDLDYNGGVQMSLSTKLNLMKLKSTSSSNNTNNTLSNPILTFKNENKDEASIELIHSNSSVDLIEDNNLNDENFKTNSKRKHLAIYDSAEEDSPESSGDEYVHTGFNYEENKLVETANPSKKLLSIVNKIAASNYFQKATEIKYIKMAMENVSNCQLLLNVELLKLTGTLALNIPPHPSDRLWYGFVNKPNMILVATPQLGEKEVSYSAISDFIADKLKLEFQKVLVFPNMDDFYIPILKSEANF